MFNKALDIKFKYILNNKMGIFCSKDVIDSLGASDCDRSTGVQRSMAMCAKLKNMDRII